jgi:hypothetical protein
MESAMQFEGMKVALLGLGAVGFVAITLIPLRGYLVLHRYRQLARSNVTGTTIYLLMVAAVLSAVMAAVDPLIRVSRCLLDAPTCHPNQSGGWFFLTTIGIVYLALELILFILCWLGRRSQPNNSFKPMPLRGTA